MKIISSCARYGFMEAIESASLTTTAELFLALRIYAVLERRKAVFFVAGAILLCQWGLVLYITSQTPKGTAQVALLLSRNFIPDLPPVPDTDPYRVCILLSTQNEVRTRKYYETQQKFHRRRLVGLGEGAVALALDKSDLPSSAEKKLDDATNIALLFIEDT
ncbi:hypothetical protein D9615_002137 [Tricholomella constricta]|uniref:Uncharacterized protein n=1 Tax=Tricholomella constricta TaxID=117010 RepID=A0A8H5MAI7_9AGAR|nr:hypothetical protein D9615_002137 [Tricholomella constricta]